MKAILSISVVAVFLIIAPGRSFALWDTITVSRDQAKAHGLEVRTKAVGQRHVHVELEFQAEGDFGAFSPEGRFKDRSGVELRIGDGDDRVMSALLREDQSKPGRVVVSFTASRASLDQTHLRVMAPYQDGGLGGAFYELRVNEFVPALRPARRSTALQPSRQVKPEVVGQFGAGRALLPDARRPGVAVLLQIDPLRNP